MKTLTRFFRVFSIVLLMLFAGSCQHDEDVALKNQPPQSIEGIKSKALSKEEKRAKFERLLKLRYKNKTGDNVRKHIDNWSGSDFDWLYSHPQIFDEITHFLMANQNWQGIVSDKTWSIVDHIIYTRNSDNYSPYTIYADEGHANNDNMGEEEYGDVPSGTADVSIPKEITLSKGKKVKVVFGITSDLKSADQKVDELLLNAIVFALEKANKKVDIHEIFIMCTTNGKHIRTKYVESRHYKYLAIDISRINGKKLVLQAKDWAPVKELQEAFDEAPHRAENFGPYLKHKHGKVYRVSGHKNHIHFSIDN